MFEACNSNDEFVHANSSRKGEEYYCWACGKPVILRRGHIVQPHFAHKANDNCDDGWSHPPKTEWHMRMQNLYETTEVRMEDKSSGERHIADAVYQDIVFEFQHSPIPAKEVFDRTRFYLRLRYRVVWVVDITKAYRDGRIRIIDNRANIYNWSHASQMFHDVPFHRYPDKIRVILYWEDSEVVDPKSIVPIFKSVGYLNHVIWAYEKIDTWEDWNGKVQRKFIPDMRVFAISRQEALERTKQIAVSQVFEKININAQRNEKIAEAFFVEREERSWQYRYY